jgi:prepilin-type N-terminal cleavage/methylation domain-containing protein
MNMSNKIKRTKSDLHCGEAGMTLIEVVIAMFILTVGLLAVAATVIYALQLGTNNRNLTQSKMLAASMLEHIETIRNTNQLNFDQIAVDGQVDNPPPPAFQFTGFLDEFSVISSNPGNDGVLGTNDDQFAVTPEDEQQSNFRRKVEIGLVNPTDPDLKQVTVTIQYPGLNGSLQEYRMVSYLSRQN